MNVPDPPDPKQLLTQAGLHAKKSWGQNFLRDQNVLRRIADAIEAGPQQPVLELGAGLGALTHHLLSRGGAVWAVERDRELVPILRETFTWSDGLHIIEADAAKLDYAELARDIAGDIAGGDAGRGAGDTAATIAGDVAPPLRVAGNLPYQISSRILVSLADASAHVERAVVMVQKEVADRARAPSGSRTYGLLSVLVQRSFDVSAVCTVPPGAFVPPPKVTSAVIQLTRHDRRLEPEADVALVRAARAAFSQRRKTLRNSVAKGLGIKPALAQELLERAQIDPSLRAEQLSMAQLVALADAVAAMGDSMSGD